MWRRSRVIDLGAPAGFPNSQALGINDRDQVVGSSWNFEDGSEAVLWDHGAIMELGRDNSAEAINNRGQIVGSRQVGGEPYTVRAILWQ
jgi:uncharacterized membrane protein